MSYSLKLRQSENVLMSQNYLMNLQLILNL